MKIYTTTQQKFEIHSFYVMWIYHKIVKILKTLFISVSLKVINHMQLYYCVLFPFQNRIKILKKLKVIDVDIKTLVHNEAISFVDWITKFVKNLVSQLVDIFLLF